MNLMTNLTLLTTDQTVGQAMPAWTMAIPFVLMIALMYFMLIRPQNKRKKAEEKMRKELTVGDEITTIGGIVGRVVAIKEDTETLVVETGADRSKIRIKKWAIASCDTVHDDEQ